MNSGIFTRQEVKKYKNYRSYKKYLIEDFKSSCGYCLIPHSHLGGIKHFDIDHYQPQGIAPDLIAEYTNLFWSCKRCNNEKSDTWPTSKQQLDGHRFFNACLDMPLEHYIFQSDGILKAISKIGLFTLLNLDLNNPDTVLIRRRIIALASQKDIKVDWNIPIKEISDAIEP